MDRKLYSSSFPEERLPRWVCPTCGKGILNVLIDTFNKYETPDSRKARNQEDWNPTYVEYAYSCSLVCLNERCKEVVVNCGEGGVDVDCDYDEHGQPEQNWVDYFRPKYFYPHLKLFLIPKGTPKDVVEEINKSFELIFCNPSSAANHIRIALESLLTHMKVKRYEIGKGKRFFLSAHKRIGLIPVKYQSIKDFCLAIKWLGNAGSHGYKNITFDDVLDAYEIMEEVLKELFEKKKETIKKLVKIINKKKGPKGNKRVSVRNSH